MPRVKSKEIKINFETKPEEVELSKLKLDLSNVRFQHLPKKLDDKEMDKLIWEEKSTRELYDQIKSAGGLYEEPIIDSDYIVLEGNRRVVCLRRLQSEAHAEKLPNLGKNVFDIIKCRVIPKHITDLDKHLLLATIHVKGKKDWPAFNKAKQIYDLYNSYKIPYDSLVKYLGMGKATIIRMVNSYEQTYKYGRTYPNETNWYQNYSYFEELFKRIDLREFTKLQRNIDRFAEWVHKGKFKDSTDVRALGQILADGDATKAFETYGFAKAFAIIQDKNPTLKSKEFKQIQKTIKLISSFSRKELVKTINDPHRKAMIRKLKEELDALVKDIDALEKK